MKHIWHNNLLKSTSSGDSIVLMKENDIPGGLLPLQRPSKNQRLTDVELTEDFVDMPDLTTPEFKPFLLQLSGIYCWKCGQGHCTQAEMLDVFKWTL